MLSLRVHDRIDAIEPDRWDAVGDDPLSTHGVLLALERAELPGVRMAYALFEDERGRPAAAVPFARIEVDAARLTHGLFRRAIAAVRRVDGGFLRTALCVCGTPLSVGNPPLRIAAGIDPRRVWVRAAGLAGELADSWDAPWRVFKELADDRGSAARCLRRANWLLAPSEPNLVLPVRWTRYEDYLRSLRHSYRYKIARSARKLAAGAITVDVPALADAYDADAHRLYEAVLERAEVRLESLTARFFTELGRCAGPDARLIRFRDGDRPVGWVAVLVAGDRVLDLFHGIDYAHNPRLDLYFNQLAETVRFAVERGARSLSLGQSTETVKTRFGARPQPRWIALKHRSAVLTAAFRRSAPLLFPERPVPVRRTFGAAAARKAVASC